MSSGVTDKMREFARQMREREQPELEARERDRTLRGKARRDARRAARRSA